MNFQDKEHQDQQTKENNGEIQTTSFGLVEVHAMNGFRRQERKAEMLF